jgi:hypothetical protein
MADSPGDDAWTEHDREQRRAWLRLTPRQRLDWLWSARSFVLRAAEARSRRRSTEPVTVIPGAGPES